MKKLIGVLVLSLAAMTAAQGSLLSIVFDNPNQTGAPGDTLHFFGTITNIDTTPGDGPVFLNYDFFTFALDATLTDNFVVSVPISLAEGASSSDLDLFDYTIANPETLSFGQYNGSYQLFGGIDGGDGSGTDLLATAFYSVDVEPAVEPEPATVGLLASGLTFIAWRSVRRRFKPVDSVCLLAESDQ